MKLSEKLHIAISDHVSGTISLADMCLLLAEARNMARRVEEAPVVRVGGADGLSCFIERQGKTRLPDMQGKRVRIVEE